MVTTFRNGRMEKKNIYIYLNLDIIFYTTTSADDDGANLKVECALLLTLNLRIKSRARRTSSSAPFLRAHFVDVDDDGIRPGCFKTVLRPARDGIEFSCKQRGSRKRLNSFLVFTAAFKGN